MLTNFIQDAIRRAAFKRRQMTYSLTDAFVRRLGFRLYNPHLQWVENPQNSFAVIKRFDPNAWRISERQFTMHSISAATAYLGGDTAECGVYRGATSYLICDSRKHDMDHTHYCFDSFQGLSPPTEQDMPTKKDAYVWKENDLACSMEETKKNLDCFGERIRFHAGWIPEQFPLVADCQFSLVHIDVDLANPTRESLEFFYPRMKPGGMIVCDDYGSTWCPGAKLACDEFCANVPQANMIHLTTGQGIILKGAST